MYYSARSITGFRATAVDGEVGRVLGFGFDDQTWEVRYVIVRASWLPGRVVLADPSFVGLVDGAKKRIHFDRTRRELRQEPDIHRDPPVHKIEEEAEAPPPGPTNLRDTSEVIGYRAVAIDGRAGRLSDVVIDTKGWKVQALVVRRGWLLRTYRTVPPSWVESIDWATKAVNLGVDRKAIRASRQFDPEAPVNTTQEVRVVDYTANTHLARRKELVGQE